MTTNPYLRSDLTVLVPAFGVAWLLGGADLDQLRGQSPAGDRLLDALETAAAELRRRNGGTASGTRRVARPERERGFEEPINTTAAAKLIGISERGVRKAAKAGRLDGVVVDGRWRFAAASARSYRDNRTA